MKKVFHKNDDVSLSFNIDPDFTGILLGFAHDVSEGCELKGELVMTTTRKTTIRGIITEFSGACRVNLKSTNTIGVPVSDAAENHIIIRRTIRHFDEHSIATDPTCPIKSTVFERGTYTFPFSIHIPPSIPHTFIGKEGSIEYKLSAIAIRGLLSPNIHITHPITLRRCLMDELDPAATNTQTVHGTTLGEILSYSASAPTMVYCEGGLLKFDLRVELKDPSRYSVRMVTCGLQERVFYRTSTMNSAPKHATHHKDFSYPLGCSTFFPSRHPDYNPAELHNYNAIFRLYPRVHTDNRSSLIVVQHALSICMIIDDNETIKLKQHTRRRRRSSSGSVSSIKSLSPKALLTHIKHNIEPLTKATSSPEHGITEEEHDSVHFTRTPSLSRSPSSSAESTTGSVVSSDSVSTSPPIDQLHPFQSNIVRVSSRKSNVEMDEGSHEDHAVGHSLIMHHHHNPLKFHKTIEEGSYKCRLSVPVIVTSRQEYREGSVPAIPDYETSVYEPPSYRASLDSLPRVPIYPLENDDTNTSVTE